MAFAFNQIPTWINDLVISLGGASVITIAIATYIGKIYEKKYLESLKQEHKKEIENLKQEHDKEIESYKVQLEVIKQTSLRYSTKQFKIYNKLWTTLCNLKVATDNLWRSASRDNIIKFSEQLNEATIEIDASALLIEDTHYLEMKEVLTELGKYQFGKFKVLEIHEHRNLLDENVFFELGGWVNANRQSKERFEKILEAIQKELKQQIRGTLN